VPNVDRVGKPKKIYFTDVFILSVIHAEIALQIGALNPVVPTVPPAYYFELDMTGCGYICHGIVPGGSANEYTTHEQPLVTTITPMVLP